MTNKELQTLLQKYPNNAIVTVWNGDCEIDNITDVTFTEKGTAIKDFDGKQIILIESET